MIVIVNQLFEMRAQMKLADSIVQFARKLARILAATDRSDAMDQSPNVNFHAFAMVIRTRFE